MDNPLVRKLSAAIDLSEEDRSVLIGLTEPAGPFERGVDLISEGDPPEVVHLVLEGIACRYKILPNGKRQILALMLPGDFCDLHVTILGSMDYSIGTLSPCRIARIPKAVVERLAESRRHFTRALWRATLVDEAILREWLAGLGQRPTDRHMAHLFCELYMRMDMVGLVSDGGFDLPLTQEDLGDILGVSVVHTNRTLMQLREEGLVAFNRRRLVVPDFERLKAFAQFRADYLHLRDERRGAPAPAAAARPAERAEDVSAPAPRASRFRIDERSLNRLAGRRVLVVEDEYHAAEELAEAVAGAGGEVVGPVPSVELALSLIAEGTPVDAAILDINLAGEKVFPVAASLRRQNIPIVFVTGYDDWMIPYEYEDVPMHRKPADPENVVRLLFRD